MDLLWQGYHSGRAASGKATTTHIISGKATSLETLSLAHYTCATSASGASVAGAATPALSVGAVAVYNVFGEQKCAGNIVSIHLTI